MKNVLFALVASFIITCGCEKTSPETNPGNLKELMVQHNYSEANEVIACAGSNLDSDSVFIFFYPEKGASNFRYFEAPVATDGNDYSNYKEIALNRKLLLNNYLYRFERSGQTEGWGIVTCMLNSQLHASNPIKFKQLSASTEYSDSTLNIEFKSPASPTFSWGDGTIKENEIFYEIVMDNTGEVLSATYTYDYNFTYYNTSNVVLNLTNPSPPEELAAGQSYIIAIMGISIDNWINLFIERPFEVSGS